MLLTHFQNFPETLIIKEFKTYLITSGIGAAEPVVAGVEGTEVSWMNPASLNNNLNPGEVYEAQYYGEQVENKDEGQEQQNQFNPALTLDPSGQWYWDYNQQQWFPYYPVDQNKEQGEDMENVVNNVGNLQLNEQDEYPANMEQGSPNTELMQPRPNDYVENLKRERQDSVMSNGSHIPEPSLERNSSLEVDNINYQYNYSNEPSPFHQQDHEQEYIPEPVHELPPATDSSARNISPAGAENYETGTSLGPPDLVDHRPNTSQPEIVSDISRPVLQNGANSTANSVPPPDMFASLPGASMVQNPLYSPPGQDNASIPDLGASLGYTSREVPDLGANSPLGARPVVDLGAEPVNQSAPNNFGARPKPRPDLGGEPSQGSQFAPDLTSQSVIQASDNAPLPPPTQTQTSESVSHDQHYDFYKGQFESAMPDITGGRSGVPPPLRPVPTQDTQGKAPDILRTEPLVPTSDRNLFMETGELREEDAVRVNYQVPETLPPPPSMNQAQQSVNKPPSDLPPMVGGNDPPSLVRMVVGESLSSTSPQTSNQRMVEGESTNQPNILQPLPTREVEGEALQDPRNFSNHRTIEGEDGPPVSQHPPPTRSWEIDGQVGNPSLSRGFSRVPNSGDSQNELGYRSSAPTSPMESSPTHLMSQTETRSAAAGSERRDQTVMGGPPTTKVPPLPTPGRAVAGQESSTPYGSRRRGDNHKKSTYDSDDDRNQDSESERERDKRYVQPRRTVSPGARSSRSKPTRGYDRFNRSSTEREDDSDRRPRDYRDRREEDRGFKKDYGRYVKGRYKDYRRGREDEEVFRDDDRRSVHGGGGGGRRIKDESYRYREDQFYRRTRNESDFERESFYGEDILNRYSILFFNFNFPPSFCHFRHLFWNNRDFSVIRSSRPASRAGSVSHYDPNESVYGRGMQGSMAYFQHQLMQQQLAMMNPLQYQVYILYIFKYMK